MHRTLVIATIALATALGFATAAGASDWRTEQDSYEFGLFLDMGSYKLLPDGHRQIWILQTFQKPLQNSGRLVDFQVSLFDFNCHDRTMAAKSTIVYFMDGQSDASETPASPAPSAPGASRMSGVVCGDLSRLTAVPGEAAVIAHRYRAISKMLLQYH